MRAGLKSAKTDGEPAAPSSTTTGRSAWIYSPPTTSISIRPPLRAGIRLCAATREFPLRADRPGLPGGRNVLYHNTGNGAFEDVPSAPVLRVQANYGLGVSTLDFNGDGWVDLCTWRTTPPERAHLNNTDGTLHGHRCRGRLRYSQDGKPRQGWALRSADYDRNGAVDLFKTETDR